MGKRKLFYRSMIRSSAVSNALPWLGHFIASYFNFWLLGICNPVFGISLGSTRIMTLKIKKDIGFLMTYGSKYYNLKLRGS